jgi:transposase
VVDRGPWLGGEPGRKVVIGVEDWAEIRRLHRAEHVPIKEIVRRLEVSRNTVRAALRSDQPPAYHRDGPGSIVDAVEPQVRALLAEWPTMPATVVAERIGWTRSVRVLRERVAELRPLFVPPDPCQRTEYAPGELAQWDLWFPPADVPLGFGQVGHPPVVVGVSGYSRWLVGRMVPSRQVHDILGGHLACLLELGGVPKAGVYDNEPALAARHGGRAKPTQAFDAFRGTLGMGAVFCKPGDPESKGLVERANRYLETSFLPGRRFASAADFNAQLGDWLALANHRVHATLGCRPADRINADRDAMGRFPPVLPDPAWRAGVRLARDHWVRAATNDYSVDPSVIGRRVEVRMDLDTLIVTCAGAVVARHARVWAKHQAITDPAHRRPTVLAAPVPAPDVEQRDLADYDRALGVA